jgi:hypothetical protein
VKTFSLYHHATGSHGPRTYTSLHYTTIMKYVLLSVGLLGTDITPISSANILHTGSHFTVFLKHSLAYHFIIQSPSYILTCMFRWDEIQLLYSLYPDTFTLQQSDGLSRYFCLHLRNEMHSTVRMENHYMKLAEVETCMLHLWFTQGRTILSHYSLQ